MASVVGRRCRRRVAVAYRTVVVATGITMGTGMGTGGPVLLFFLVLLLVVKRSSVFNGFLNGAIGIRRLLQALDGAAAMRGKSHAVSHRG